MRTASNRAPFRFALAFLLFFAGGAAADDFDVYHPDEHYRRLGFAAWEEGRSDEAATIYDKVRQSAAPQPRILEATRGAILARGRAGLPLLVEQLRSSDQDHFEIGLSTARQLQVAGVAEALAQEAVEAPPERGALLLATLLDLDEHVLPAAVLSAAKSGAPPVRVAALAVIGRRGDASIVPALLKIGVEGDPQVSHAAENTNPLIATAMRTSSRLVPVCPPSGESCESFAGHDRFQFIYNAPMKFGLARSVRRRTSFHCP